MTYSETLEYLFARLPMYQRMGKKALKLDLRITIELLEVLNNPHHRFKSVHIAGTNGKGTSAHGVAAILQSAGYRTGLYTSPHLKHFTERIRLDGQEIDEAFVVDFVANIRPEIDRLEPSFFEITVAMAFAYFAEMKVDIAVIETGMGGRLDSTNVIIPEVSLITNIGLDHTDILGDTIAKIAFEKAGIIKEGVPVIIGEKHNESAPVFDQVAKERNARLVHASPFEWNPDAMVPDYLKLNVGGIRAVILELVDLGWQIEEDHFTKGLNNMNALTGLKGRFQVLGESPTTIADVSHNPDGLKVLFDQVQAMCTGQLHVIFGTVKDKELGPVFDVLPAGAKLYWTQSSVPRALAVEELAIQAAMNGLQGECFKDANEAVSQAKLQSSANDLILITGSTFVVAELDDL